MEVIKKITTINNGIISFDSLNKYNHQKVKVIVLPLINNDLKNEQLQKENFLKYDGMFKSSFTNTSNTIDELIYGK